MHGDVYRVAFERLETAALIIDREGTVLATSRRLEHLLGPDLRGSPLERIAAGHSSALLVDLKTAAGGIEITVRLRDVSGEPRRFGCRVTPLPGRAPASVAYLIVLDDVRPMSNMFETFNRDLRETRERFVLERESRRDAERRLQQLEDFSLHTAHDLKAPLLQVEMLLDMLDEDHGRHLPADGLDMLAKARLSADRLQRLIDVLLDHARLDSAEIVTTSQSLENTIDNLLQDFEGSLEEARAVVRIDRPLGHVEGDGVLLRQLIENLLSNALKYRAMERPLHIGITSEKLNGSVVELRVRDNGQGFDGAAEEKIFEPFSRATSSGVEGSGIGLSACRKICDRHGWSIAATGRPGEGAEFRIRFQENPSLDSVERAA